MASSQAGGESSESRQHSSSIPNGESALDSNKNYVNEQCKFLCGVVEGECLLLKCGNPLNGTTEHCESGHLGKSLERPLVVTN